MFKSSLSRPKSQVARQLAALAGASALMVMAACAPIRDVRGYVPDAEKVATVKKGEDTRDTVLNKLGTPSSTAAFGDAVWYYISSEEERYAFFTSDTTQREILAVQFNEEGKVTDIRKYGLDDGKVVALVSRETPTRGREMSLLQQIFGNLGAPGSAAGAGQDNRPGGR